ILDLSWSTGRLVREYTLLFDPPSTARASTQTTSPVIETPAPTPQPVAEPPAVAAAPIPPVAPVTPARPAASRPSAPPAPAPAPAMAPAPAPVAEQAEAPSKPRRPARTASEAAPVPAPAAAAPAPAPAPAKVEPAASAAEAAAARESADKTVRVKSGDSLSRIAARTAPAGVSLDQMLVSLYRSNPSAFVGNNMNRLKSGVVLNVPSADEAKSVTNSEARQVIQAQSADFAAYRQHLAAAVTATTPDQPQRQASGKVQAEVDDRKQAATPAPDKLTLSRSEERRVGKERGAR